MTSIVLGGQIDLLAGDYRCMLAGLDLGAAQPIQDVVRSLVGDGSRVIGWGSDNRSVVLPVMVSNPDAASRDASVEALAKLVNGQTFTLAVTGRSEKTAVLDCFRGKATPRWDQWHEGLPWLIVDVEYQALPYWRSDAAELVSGSSSSVQLGDFAQATEYAYHVPSDQTTVYSGDITTVSFATTGTAYGPQTSPTPIDGSGCMRVDMTYYRYQSTQFFSAAKVGPVTGTWNLQGMSVTLGLLWWTVTSHVGDVALVLKDSSNATQEFYGSIPSGMGWLYTTISLSGATIDLSNITAWTLYVSQNGVQGVSGSPDVVYLGMLRGYPSSSQLAATSHGAVLKFSGVKGSARTTAKLTLDRGGTNTMSGLLLHRSPPDADPTTPTLIPLTSGSGSTSAPSLPNGTYRVYSCGASANVTIAQKVNGTQVATKTLTANAIPGTTSVGDCGDVQLPLKYAPGDVTNVLYAVTSGTSVTEVMLCDTRGLTILVPTFTAAKYLRVDEPDVGKDVGRVYTAGAADFSDATSITDAAQISGALTLEDGDNYVTLWCPDGLPSTVKLEYFPRWLIKRTD